MIDKTKHLKIILSSLVAAAFLTVTSSFIVIKSQCSHIACINGSTINDRGFPRVMNSNYGGFDYVSIIVNFVIYFILVYTLFRIFWRIMSHRK
jgi:hypothetical protein